MAQISYGEVCSMCAFRYKININLSITDKQTADIN